MTQNQSIALAKGIGIILMVVGHSGAPAYATNFIYMFHMPLFFFLSGYFFKPSYLEDKTRYVVKKFKGLYLPFIGYSLLFLWLHNVFYHLNIYNESYSYSGGGNGLYELGDFLKRSLLIIVQMSGSDECPSSYWFIRDLFIISLLFFALQYLVSRLGVKFKTGVIATVGLFLLSAAIFSYSEFSIPKLLIGSRTLYAGALYALGWLYADLEKRISYSWIGALICAAAIGAGTYLMPVTINASYAQMPYGIVMALAGLYLTLYISRNIRAGRLHDMLSYVGNHTLIVLTFHMISFKLVSLLKIHLYGLDIRKLACLPVIPEHNEWFFVLYSIVGVAAPLLVYYYGSRLYAIIRSCRTTQSVKPKS